MKTVMITGSSTGIGRATAIYFQKKSFNVAATMRKPEKEKELTKLERVICPALDVTDSGSIDSALKIILDKFGSIDVVVNNAGYSLIGTFESASTQEIADQFNTNVFGIFNVMRAIIPHFRKQQGGVIINLSSVGGRMGFPLYSFYNSTKWAVEGFSEAIHYELSPFNIRVKLIEPGAILTDFYSRSMKATEKQGLTAYDPYITKTKEMLMEVGKRGISPEAVAKVIYKAALSNNNKLHYKIGKDGRFVLFLRSVLPDRLFRGMARRIFMKK